MKNFLYTTESYLIKGAISNERAALLINGLKIPVRVTKFTQHSAMDHLDTVECAIDTDGFYDYCEQDVNTTKTLYNRMYKSTPALPTIKNVIFNDPATVVMWDDGTKTVVKCQPNDVFDPEKGLAMAIAKRYLGNKGNFNETFKKWVIPYYESQLVEKKTEVIGTVVEKKETDDGVSFTVDVANAGVTSKAAKEALESLTKSAKKTTFGFHG